MKSVSKKKDDSYISDVKAFARSVFAKSYIQSFSVMAETRSMKERILKFAVFIICLTGFIYQCSDFVLLFMSYPTIKNEVISKPQYLELPALTFCNKNRLRRSLACESGSVHCENISEVDLCHMYPNFCVEDKNPYPKTTDRKSNIEIWKNTHDWSKVRKESHSTGMIKSCLIQEAQQSVPCRMPYLETPLITADGLPTFCYTLNSDWGNSDAGKEPIGKEATIVIELETEPDEYLFGDEQPGIYVMVHERKSRPNPFIDGYELKGGVKYIANLIDMTEKTLLPPPYDTKCRNYLKDWKQNDGTGPVTEEECLNQCKLERLMKNHKCIIIPIYYPHLEPICGRDDLEDTDEVLQVEDACLEECANECFYQTYEVEYEEEGRITCDAGINSNISEWCRVSTVALTLSFSVFRFTVVSYEPRFQDIEFFSNIGGYMGMWIGISLIEMIDFVEGVSKLLMYAVKRKKQN